MPKAVECIRTREWIQVSLPDLHRRLIESAFTVPRFERWTRLPLLPMPLRLARSIHFHLPTADLRLVAQSSVGLLSRRRR